MEGTKTSEMKDYMWTSFMPHYNNAAKGKD